MHKDKLTGTEVVDYDFLGKKLYPPRKMKITDAGKAFAALFRELDSFYYPSRRKIKNNILPKMKGSSCKRNVCRKQTCKYPRK